MIGEISLNQFHLAAEIVYINRIQSTNFFKKNINLKAMSKKLYISFANK